MRSLIILCLALGACTTAQTAQTNTALTTAQNDLNAAVVAYNLAKDAATIVVQANPKLAATVTNAEAAADPIIAKAQIVLADATADAPTVEAMASLIQAQVAALKAP